MLKAISIRIPPKVTFSDAVGTAVFHLGLRNTCLLTCCVVREPQPVWPAFFFFFFLVFFFPSTSRNVKCLQVNYFPSPYFLLSKTFTLLNQAPSSLCRCFGEHNYCNYSISPWTSPWVPLINSVCSFISLYSPMKEC